VDAVRRLLMGASGIDLPGFVRKLDRMGYSGPVMRETFSQSLDEIIGEDALNTRRLAVEAIDEPRHAGGPG
jgi:sugar phosphate isomerase/epimerase